MLVTTRYKIFQGKWPKDIFDILPRRELEFLGFNPFYTTFSEYTPSLPRFENSVSLTLSREEHWKRIDKLLSRMVDKWLQCTEWGKQAYMEEAWQFSKGFTN